MAKPQRLTSCCGCYGLKAGTIIAGVLGILLSIATIVVILTTRIDFKTVVSWTARYKVDGIWYKNFSICLDLRWLDLSLSPQNHFDCEPLYDNHSVFSSNRWCHNCKNFPPSNVIAHSIIFDCISAQSLSLLTMDHLGNYALHWASSRRHLHSSRFLPRE